MAEYFYGNTDEFCPVNSAGRIRLPVFTAAASGSAWAYDAMQTGAVHAAGFTGKGVIVAVLDTGCATSHTYIKRSVIGGYNFTRDFGGSTSMYNDNNSHGTHIAGIIAAQKNPINSMCGIAPGARLLIYKVLDRQGGGDVMPIVRAINAAVAYRSPKGERVSVISMSFGTRRDYPALRKAVRNAAASGVLMVTAAGNEGDSSVRTPEISYPGYYPEVIQVGACDIDGAIPAFSNTNKNIDVVAPGVNVLSLGTNNDYSVMSGTSMAAPHISGAAAVIIEQFASVHGTMPTPRQLYTIICSSTVKLGYSARSEGHGMFRFDKLRL